MSSFRRWFLRLFERGVRPYLRHARWAYATVAVLFLVGCAALPQMDGRSLIPSPQERTLLISLETDPGTSLTEMQRVTSKVMNDVSAVNGVRLVGSHVGRAVTGDQIVDVNSGELWVNLADSAGYETTVDSISRVLRAHREVQSNLSTYPEDQLRTAQSGTSKDIVVRVYGPDLKVLLSQAERMRQLISTVPGVDRPTVQSQPEQPAIEVKVNLAAAQRYGLNPGDVRRAAATYYAGLLVGNLYEEQKVFEVVVRGAPSKLSTPKIGDLLIDTPGGAQMPLSDLASVQVVQSPTLIKHDATSRYIDVTAEVSGRDLRSVVAEVNHRLSALKMPLEYHVEVLSGPAIQQAHDLRAAGLAIGVALVVFLLLQAAFASWRLAALVFLTVPLAAAGGVISAAFVGTVMSTGALTGLLIVLGVAVRNGVLLVRRYQTMDAVDGSLDRSEFVVRTTRESAALILLPAGATCTALLPLVWMGPAAGTEVLHPLAVVVVGGLVTATIVSLFVLPALYLRITPAVMRDLPPTTGPANGGGTRRRRDSRLTPIDDGAPAGVSRGS